MIYNVKNGKWLDIVNICHSYVVYIIFRAMGRGICSRVPGRNTYNKLNLWLSVPKGATWVNKISATGREMAV